MVTRRSLLFMAAAAGGGMVVGVRPASGQAATNIPLNAWIRIGSDNIVTLIASQSELGQGAMTTLPAILAEELGADWNRVKIEFSGTAPAYKNPRVNWQFTGNSESTTGFFELLRSMGAAGREMLIRAAAKRWNAAPELCTVTNSRVILKGSDKTLTFGEIAQEAAQITLAQPAKPKPRSEWKLLGRSLRRVDLPAKLNGTAVFGTDFSVPDIVHGAALHAPTHRGELKSFDKASIAEMPGVIDVIPVPNGVVVVAQQYWQASQAARKLKVEWTSGNDLGSDQLKTQYRAALESGKLKNVLAKGAWDPQVKNYSQEYESQFLAHATMEPMNCTVHVTSDGCKIWGPLQGNELTKLTLAGVLKLDPEKVIIERTLVGGGFGRRLTADFVIEAALASKAVGKPVKVIWSRQEDMQHDLYRPATLQRISATVDASGKPTAIAHKVVSPSILQYVFSPAVTEDNDPSCLEGLLETHYQIPNQRVDFHLLKTAIPTSVLRTTGYGPNIFAVESFIDELAHESKQDPYQFRRSLLQNERALKVLDTAAKAAGWGKAGRTFKGMAYTEAFRTHIAHVVELSVNGNDVKIHRIVAVIDPGIALDPEICKNSIEGGTIWGLSCAFKSEIAFANGRTVQSNFHDYKILQMYEAPPVEVHIVNSDPNGMGGAGEVGPVTLVPAVANAIFAATGKRHRSLPLSAAGLRLV